MMYPVERVIGHDHLVSMGFAPELVTEWLEAGQLHVTTWPGFYRCTEAFERDLTRLATRRCIGRGHLLALGVTAREVQRWQRSGVLRGAGARGFYEIAVGLLEQVLRREPGAAAPDDLRGAPNPPEPQVVEPPPAAPECPSPSPGLRVVACTIGQARAFVAAHHRHLKPPPGGLFAVGVALHGQLVGAAIVGRPVARQLQNGETAEVTRVCTGGERNAYSMLLSACRRGAAALGYRRVITYTLETEPGASLRGAGWHQVATVKAASWHRDARPRAPGLVVDKRRWEAPLAA